MRKDLNLEKNYFEIPERCFRESLDLADIKVAVFLSGNVGRLLSNLFKAEKVDIHLPGNYLKIKITAGLKFDHLSR